jgi:alanine racemase
MARRLDRAWMDVDLGALVRNARTSQARSGVPLIPMIKADAYGLGAEAVAKALESVDPYAYGIATIAEGRALRRAGITRQLIVFTPLLADEYKAARDLALTPTLGSADEIARWCEDGSAHDWQLSIDTGMSRAGVPWREAGSLASIMERHPPGGAFTHFHSAELDDSSMAEQEERFRKAIATLPARPPFLHTDGSAAIVRHERSEWDAIRPGIYLYGVGSEAGPALDPEPVVHVRARVVETRWIERGDSVSYDATYRAESRRRIATIPMGYADGYPRALSNRGSALTSDGVVPIAGLVTMDMIMLDVTDSACQIGDEVTLIGSGGSGRSIGFDELAQLAGMSYYEIMTGLGSRLDRYYVESEPR